MLDHDLVARTLKKSGMACELLRVERLDDFLEALRTGSFDTILADYRLPGFTALDAWNALQGQPQRPPSSCYRVLSANLRRLQPSNSESATTF